MSLTAGAQLPGALVPVDGPVPGWLTCARTPRNLGFYIPPSPPLDRRSGLCAHGILRARRMPGEDRSLRS